MRLRILQAISVVTLVALGALPALAQRRNERVTIKRGGFGVDDFSPKTGGVGTEVVITGRGFSPETRVLLGGRLVAVSRVNPTQLTFTIPAAFGDGALVLRQPGVAKDVYVGKIAVAANPEVRRLSPTTGVPGTRVEVHGSGFQQGDQVTMNGRAIRVMQVSPNRLLVEIPLDAQSDHLTVARPGGPSSRSPQRFDVAKPAPTLSAIAPPQGAAGITVRLSGTNLDTVSTVRYGKQELRIVLRSATHLDVELPAGLRGNHYFLVEGAAGSARSAQQFVLDEPPFIARFSPAMGLEGQRVELFGENFRAGATVSLGGVPVRIIQLRDKRMLIEIPRGAPTGAFSLSQGVEATTSSATFEVLHAPVVTAVTPPGGPEGQRVVLAGQYFTPEATVFYGATPLRIERRSGDSQLEVTVPRGATDQSFTVRTRGGDAVSAAFRVHYYPVVRRASPNQGFANTIVEFTGPNMNYVDAVFLGSVSLPIVERTPNRLTARIVAPAASGTFTLESFGQASPTRQRFQVISEPVISSFAPTVVTPGSQLAITGLNFSGTTTIFFGELALPVVRRSLPSQLIVEVPRTFSPRTDYLWAIDGPARVRAASTISISTPPTIASFAPEYGKPGTIVALRGIYFGPQTQVFFDDLPVTVTSRAGDRELVVQVPFTATSKNPYFTVRDENGEHRATRAFKLLPAATIAGFAQPSGRPGAKILIKGSGFDTTTRLYWGAQPLTVDKVGPRGHRIWFIVPNLAGGSDFVTADDHGAKSVSPVQFRIEAPPAAPPPPPPPRKIKVRDHRKK